MSQAKEIIDSLLTKLENVEENVSEEVLKKVDDAVFRIIQHYRKASDADTEHQNQLDIEYLMAHPRDTLLSMHEQLRLEQPKVESLFKSKSKPQLVPKQPFNNINLFDRMPHGFTRKTPKDKDDLKAIIQDAADNKKNVKAVGACYSFSNIAFTDGVIIEMNKHLHNIQEIDETVLNKDNKLVQNKNLCQMEAGTLIESILEHLWPKDCRDKVKGYKTMMNITGYSGLSIAGTTGTGAHGSGIDKPPLCDGIESIHLITVNAEMKVVEYRIEPTEGITDPVKFNNAQKYKGITLIQDDDTFYATTVHVGSMGVIYSYIIKVQDAFYLQEHRKMMSWEEMKVEIPQLIKENLSGSIHSFEAWISPYPALYSTWVFGVVSVYKPAQPPRVGKRPISFETSNFENELIRILTVWVSKNFQRLLPLVMFFALCLTLEKEPVTMPSTEALSFGSPNGVKVLVSENGVDASDPATPIKAVDDMIKSYQDALQEDNRFFTTSPFSMRFTSASKSFLAMQYNRPSCMIETPNLLDTFGQHSTLRRARNLTQEKYRSRPHWGQVNNMTGEKLKELYPESYEKFIKAYKKFNVSKMFSNYFTKDFDDDENTGVSEKK